MHAPVWACKIAPRGITLSPQSQGLACEEAVMVFPQLVCHTAGVPHFQERLWLLQSILNCGTPYSCPLRPYPYSQQQSSTRDLLSKSHTLAPRHSHHWRTPSSGWNIQGCAMDCLCKSLLSCPPQAVHCTFLWYPLNPCLFQQIWLVTELLTVQ